MPPDDGLWLDNHHCVQAAGPKTIEQNPKGSVQPREPDTGSLVTSKNLDLVAKNGHLELQVDTSSEAGKEPWRTGTMILRMTSTLRSMAPNSEDFCANGIYGRDRCNQIGAYKTGNMNCVTVADPQRRQRQGLIQERRRTKRPVQPARGF